MCRNYVIKGTAFILILVFLFTACKQEKAPEKETTTETATEKEETSAEENIVLSTFGPNNEEPVSADIVRLTDGQVNDIRSKKLKLAIVMHDLQSDFSKALVAGVEKACSDYNIEVVITTDAGFDGAKQSQDFADAIALDPDIIISLILDANASAEALAPAVKNNTKIALLSNLPSGFRHGTDYAGIVTDDLFSMGKYIADMMGDNFAGDPGKVVLMYHDATYYVTNQRDQAVKTVLNLSYPNIEVLASVGIANPADAKDLALQIFKDHPDVQAIYAPWDTIAEGVVEAARESGKDDLAVFTMDLGVNNAIDMVKGGNIKGVVADLPFEMGYTLTRLGSLAVLGEVTPEFIIVDAIKVTKSNIEDKWKEALNADLPEEVKAAF